VSPPKKQPLNQPTPAVETGKPLTPLRADGPTNTVIVAEEADDPRAVKTSAMEAFVAPPAEGATTTQPTPAWPSAPAEAAIVTAETPVWEEDVANVKTRAVATPPANATDATTVGLGAVDGSTRVELAPVADDVRQAVTRPSQRPDALSKPVKLALAAIGTLSLVLMLWLFGRSDTVADPSRPAPIAKLPKLEKPTAPAPLPEKRVDITPTIAAPKEAARPPLTMDLTVDAGAGLPPEVKKVPASIVRIETEPLVAVSWNGEDFGWTPALITMPVGQNVIVIENKEVGLKKSMTITAADEERTFLRFEFAKGWLSIDRPATAKVSVEGVGRVSQRAILVWEGRHRIDVVFASGQKASKVADVVRGETAELFFDEPLPQE
jgi:hypothetical protein